jgi:hypothetical protein
MPPLIALKQKYRMPSAPVLSHEFLVKFAFRRDVYLNYFLSVELGCLESVAGYEDRHNQVRPQ